MATEKIYFDKNGNKWEKVNSQYTKIVEEKCFLPNFYEPDVLYFKKLQ